MSNLRLYLALENVGFTFSTGKSPTDYPPVSVSSRFNLESWDMQDADVLFLTPEQVFFYAHRSVLLQYSPNSFGGLLVDDATYDAHEEIDVSQPMSDSDSDLSLETLYPRTKRCAKLSQPWSAAAQCSLESLAVAVNALTLRASLHEITDELSQQMGPVYMKRLFSAQVLHLGRADALKRIVLPQPNLHPPDSNSKCNSETQKSVQRAWTLVSAYIIAQNHPDDVGDVVSLLDTRIECTECSRSLQERISRLVHDWSAVKYTIYCIDIHDWLYE
ncbi:hypothetical protein B0J17DRAFT_706669 [Rhizoctonia solani]|nr:hypothetical protein B0J17DRAFT_706669 [Rhizoctonia solani]